MAAAAYQPAPSKLNSYLNHSFGEQQQMLDQTHRKRQGMVIRSRSKTTSTVPRESTYFPVDPSTGGIGESPRSSYSAHRYSQERSAVGRILSLSNNAWASDPPKPPPKPLPPPKPNSIPSTSHPIRVAVQSPNPKKPQESNGTLDSQYMDDLFSPTRPIPPLHPYATARATVPPIPPEARQPRRLATSTSVPNLRKASSFAKTEGRRAINLVAETWCDALVFPRPRLKAHRLSITLPPTPLTPPSANSQQLPAIPNNPDLSTTPALFKAVQEGATRDVEKTYWNQLATHSFQNSRSRSLSRSHSQHHKAKVNGPVQSRSHTFVKRGIEVLAESAFAQGASSQTNTMNSSRAHSHSRNTSLATDTRQSISQRTPPSDSHGSVESRSQGRPRAISEGHRLVDPSPRMYDQQPSVSRTPGAHVPSTTRPLRVVPNFTPREDARTGEQPVDDSEVGIAVTTPTSENPSPVRLIGHPYASPDYTMSTNYRTHSHKTSTSSSVAGRHRSSRPKELRNSGSSADHYLKPDSERSSARDSYIGPHAYALTEPDDTIIDFGEALMQSFKRSSGGSSDHGHYLEQPVRAPPRTEKRAVPKRPPLVATLKPPPPPVRYEPVKFEKYPSPSQNQSRSLSPITDVTTPASSRSRSTGAPDISEVFSSPSHHTPPRNRSHEEDIQNNSNDSEPTLPTTESSPSTSEEPPILDNTFDHSPYKNLFFRPSPSNSPDHAGSSRNREVETEAVSAASREQEASPVADTNYIGPSKPMATRSLDLPESVGKTESEDSLYAVGSEDELDFTLRQVQRVSITTISPSTPRPLSAHIFSEGRHEQTGLPSSDEIVLGGSHRLSMLSPPDSSARDSSYSGVSDTSLSRITSSFPAPPTRSGTATPSTLLDAYFTATDNTPAQSRESILDN